MISIVSIIFLSIINLQSGEWKLEKDRDGIKVFTREVQGFAVRQFSARSTTAADLNKIESLMRDLSSYESWMPDVAECRIVEKKDEDTFIYQMTIDSPFPVKDRDIVAQMKFTRPESNVLHISYQNLPDYLPTSSGAVRIPYFKGYWEFTYLNDSTIIKNEFLSDPGGSVPSWVINSFITRNPYQTILNLKKQIE